MKKLQNWWYYYKWYVIGGSALLGTVFYLIGNAFGLFEKQPDFQIAYVADSQLPQDTVTSLNRPLRQPLGISMGMARSS